MSLLDSIFAPRIVRAGVEYVQRDTLEIVGSAGVVVADDPPGDRVTITVPEANPAHAATHRNQGTDVVDGDRVRVDYVPSTGYARAVAPVSTAPEDLASHLHGAGVATAAARGTADGALATATAAYDTAVAASATASSAAVMFHWSYASLGTGGPATRHLYPDCQLSGASDTDWTSRQLITQDGTLTLIVAHHAIHNYTPIFVNYRVWLSTDNGLTFAATALQVNVMSNTNVANSATGSVAVVRGNMIGVEVYASGALQAYDRMMATVLFRAT